MKIIELIEITPAITRGSFSEVFDESLPVFWNMTNCGSFSRVEIVIPLTFQQRPHVIHSRLLKFSTGFKYVNFGVNNHSSFFTVFHIFYAQKGPVTAGEGLNDLCGLNHFGCNFFSSSVACRKITSSCRMT